MKYKTQSIDFKLPEFCPEGCSNISPKAECCKLFGDDDVTIRIMEYTCAREYLCAELMESLRGETEAENEQ